MTNRIPTKIAFTMRNDFAVIRWKNQWITRVRSLWRKTTPLESLLQGGVDILPVIGTSTGWSRRIDCDGEKFQPIRRRTVGCLLWRGCFKPRNHIILFGKSTCSQSGIVFLPFRLEILLMSIIV